jgi:hypothetical protein
MRVPDDRIEDRLRVPGSARERAQDVGGGRLLLDRLLVGLERDRKLADGRVRRLRLFSALPPAPLGSRSSPYPKRPPVIGKLL